MYILLLNTNPVVSRLLALCMRESHINFEELNHIVDISLDKYDIVFVDEASYNDEIKELLSNIIIRKKVFFSSSNEMSDKEKFFDIVIKKPFLPSQITEVLKSLKDDNALESMMEIPSIFPFSSNRENEKETDKTIEESTAVLDGNEIEKIKALLEMDEEGDEVCEEEYEIRKREVIKQQLITDGLEIIDENEYVEELSKKSLLNKNHNIKNKKHKLKKKKNIKLSQKELINLEKTLRTAINDLKPKKLKKLLEGKEIKVKIILKDNK